MVDYILERFNFHLVSSFLITLVFCIYICLMGILLIDAWNSVETFVVFASLPLSTYIGYKFEVLEEAGNWDKALVRLIRKIVPAYSTGPEPPLFEYLFCALFIHSLIVAGTYLMIKSFAMAITLYTLIGMLAPLSIMVYTTLICLSFPFITVLFILGFFVILFKFKKQKF